MSNIWQELEAEAFGTTQKGGKPTDIWGELEADAFGRAKPPESRGILGAANDYVIEAANAILGGGKALVDFASPGTELANQIEALIRQGEESQSTVARQAKQRLSQGIEAGGMEALGAVGEYITESPGLAISQAVGSFALPMGAIKGAQLGARALGATGRAADRAENIVGPFTPTGAGSKAAARAAAIRGVETRVGTAAGMGVGAVLGAGEAAGDAYEQVYQGLVDQGVDPVEADRQATEAARLAMPAPAAVGAIAGRFGAERAVAAGTRGGSILRMAGSEAAQEFAEEGTTKLSANIAAGQYVDGIDPMKGVLGSAALGAALGGITGGAIGTITPLDRQAGSLLGGANDQLSGSRTPGGDALRQAINVQQGAGLSTQALIQQITGISRVEGVDGKKPKPLNTAASMEAALNEPTGQMVSGPGGIERQLTAGELYGVPRAPAQAPAGQPPAQAASQQRAQPATQPVTQEEYVQTAQAYGVAPVQGIANTWDLGGARVYGQPNIKAVVEGLAQADRQTNPVQREVNGALLAANLVKISGNIANAKPVINAINRAVQKFGLTDVSSVEEAVARVNDQIGNLARQGKPATNTTIEQLDQLHVALTGESSPVYTQLLEGVPSETQQTTTGMGAVPEQAGAGGAVGAVGRTDVGPLQSLLAGSDVGRPSGVQDVAAGVGGARVSPAVAPAGEPVGDGRPVSGQVPDQRQEVNVQPTGQPSPGAQTNVGRTFRVTRPRAEGAGAGAPEAAARVEPTVEPRVERAGESEKVVTARRIFDAIATRFEVGSRFDNLAPALQNIWLEAVAANKATIEVIRALDTENQLNDASMSAQNILDTAVSKLFPMAKQQNKARFVAEMLGTPQAARNETVKQLAERFKVSEDTIKKDWNRTVKALLGEDRPKLVGAIDAVMRERGLNQEQVSELLADLQEAVDLARTTETLTAVPEGEAQIDKRDLADPEKDLRETDRKSLSVQEFGNEAEVLSARYVRLSEEIDTLQSEIDAAQADGENALVAELSARLDELNTTLAETEAEIVKNADRQVKAVRRTAGRVKKEKEDAVQEPGAEELDVRQRARAGEEVAEKDAEKQAIAREGKAEGKAKGKVVRVVKAAPKVAPAPAVSKTKAEEVEAKYNELRGFAPDLLPEWSMLTEEQRNKLLAIDNPADINFKNLEQLVDETNVIDVEAVEITPAQRTLLLTETSKLNGEQVKLLESEYGAKSGTEAFLNKLNQDITNYVNKGAEFVAARIRGIIQQLAKAALAVAVIFNPTIVGTNFGFDLQNAYASIKAQKLEAVIPVDVISEMSPEAQTAYQQLAPVAKQSNRGFIIADKPNGKIHMFYSSGQHLVTDTALYGKGVGDILQGDTNRGFDWSKKVTPAGKFTLKAVPDAGYEGGYRLDLVETNDGVGVIAIHPAYLGDAKEKRLERLASPDVKDNRISYGCINTSHGTFLNKIKPQLGEFNGGMVVVLPDGPFSPKPSARPVQFSRRRRDEMTKSNVADIEQSIYNFVGAVNQERLRIVQSIKDVPLYVREAIKRDEGIELSRTEQAFVYGGRAYLIADNIVPGTERAVFMHEVGSHLGLEKILSNKQIIALAEQIQKWTNKDDGSVESRIANAAYDRLIAAKLEQAGVYGKLSPTSRKELIAYFIEEATLAGINPTAIDAKTALGRWFRTVWAAFKAAIRKLRLDPERLNAVDVVNMAYGAAKLEITGTWHGSAAIFQNFRTQYIGTGEGAQAFGWGMYFARSYGIAKDYFLRDKQRKALLTFANADKAAPLLDELLAKADKALDEADTFPALNRELNRDVINPETQEVLFPKGTVLTKNALIEMHRLGINIIEIKGSSLPKTDPDFDPRVSAAEIPVVPYHKLPEDSLWLQPSMGLTSLSTTLQTMEFFELWYTLDMPGLIDKLAESDKSKPRAYWAQFVLNDFRKNHPEFTDATNSFYVTANPAGSIMRADIGFGVDQTLIWDKPFSQQSLLVQEKLLQAKGLANFPKDMLDSASGKAIYQFFATGALGRDYIAGQDKEASEKLYNLGIKGISYFDRSSRTIDFLSYSDRTDLNAVARKLGTTGESLANEIEWLGAEQVINKYSLLDGGNMRSEVLAYEKYIDQNRTRNIIAFNEADVVRAFSQIGMEGSTAIDRVQFSRRADAAISRLPTVAQPQATQIYYTLKDWASKVAPTFAFTQDLGDMAKKLMASSENFLRLLGEKQVTQTQYELQVKAITDAYDALPNEVKGVGAGSVNRFIKDSTMSGKWGYKIKSDSNVTLDPQLEARFNAFPKEAQDVIKSVFDHGYKVLQDMKNAIRNNVNTEYDALIEDAKKQGDDKKVAKLQEAKDGLLRDYQRLFAMRGTGPYAPLKRFGNYVVIGKSQRYLDLEAEVAKPDANEALRKQLTELQRQAEHYYVAFAETAGEGQVIANSIRNQYAMVTDPFEKSAEDSRYGGSDLNQVFARLRNLAEQNLNDADNTAVARGIRKMIVNMQTMMLSQQSVMHATNRRLGVAGADDDMMRAFSTQGRASAHFIGSLTNTGKIYEQLRKMREEAGYNPEARRYFNEFVLRHNMGYDYDPSPLLNKAMATTSLWMLLTSPAYYLQNLTQPIMMSVPFMAGKRNRSYAATQKALFDAYKEVGKLLQDISIKRPGQQVDFDKLPPDVRDMVKELVKRGRIQITLDRDLGEYASGEDSAFRKLGKVSEYLRSVAEKVELTNRIATAVAAYRLEISDGVNSSEATNYADKVIRVTHGSYAGADAPRVMRKGVGRLVTQFRKFQLIQISMMVRLLNDATKSVPSNERYAARKALVWTLTHAGVAGGIMGLPGFYAAAALYGMLFADEDEPFDAEVELRKYFGDELGTLMTKGLPASLGADVSGKIGMGQMLSILPYTDFSLSRAGWQETVTAAMGPFIGGLIPRAIDGARFISEGNYYRGLENLLPKGVGDTLKGVRLSTEGITQRNNDVVLDAEEINFVDGMFQAFGLPTTKLTEQQFRTRASIETEEFYSKLTTELKREYAKAYRDNDATLMRELRERWKRIQDARVERELKRQPLSALLKAPREQEQRERQTARGVQYTPATRRFVESLPT